MIVLPRDHWVWLWLSWLQQLWIWCESHAFMVAVSTTGAGLLVLAITSNWERPLTGLQRLTGRVQLEWHLRLIPISYHRLNQEIDSELQSHQWHLHLDQQEKSRLSVWQLRQSAQLLISQLTPSSTRMTGEPLTVAAMPIRDSQIEGSDLRYLDWQELQPSVGFFKLN